MNVRDLVPWSRGERERSPATRSDSLNPVMSLHREMNRLFDDVFQGFDDSRLFAGHSGWPSMDVEETDKEYRITAELPGLEERDVEVLLQDGLLTVRGEKKLESENRNRAYSERFYGRFERQITLDRDVDDSAGCIGCSNVRATVFAKSPPTVGARISMPPGLTCSATK